MSRSVAIIGTRGYPSFYGGFETAVRKLAPYLVDHEWDVTVYGRSSSTPGDPNRDPRVNVVTTRGIENKSLSTLSYGLTACLHAAWKKPDVALVMNVANGFWLPTVGHSRDTDSRERRRDRMGARQMGSIRKVHFQIGRPAYGAIRNSPRCRFKRNRSPMAVRIFSIITLYSIRRRCECKGFWR